MRGESQVERYRRRLSEIEAVVEEFLDERRGVGEAQVLVSDVRQRLLLVDGRPTGLATSVLTALKARGKVRDVVMSGRDGVVYL